jgi:hypothetical protein
MPAAAAVLVIAERNAGLFAEISDFRRRSLCGIFPPRFFRQIAAMEET